MKKMISIILMAVMCVSFVASCGEDKGLTAEKIEGTWEFDMSLSEFTALSGEESEEALSEIFGVPLDFSDAVFKAEMTFNADGSCQMGISNENMLSAFKEIFSDFASAMEKDKSIVCRILSAGLEEEMTEEELDEYFSAQGMTYEDYVSYMKSIYEDEEMISALVGSSAGEALENSKYTIDGNRIYLNEDKTEYIEVEYSETQMKVTGYDENNAIMNGKVLKKAAAE